MGIDPQRARILRPGTAEILFDTLKSVLSETVQGRPLVDLVVVDSVAALITEAEDEAEMSDAQVGVLARLMSKACRQLSAVAARTGAAVVFINQTRMKIGVMYGNPETTTGGEALSFYAWSRIRTSKVRDIKEGDKIVGQETRATIVKAKLDDAVGGEAVFPIMRKDGIDTCADLLKLGLALGLVAKQGPTYAVSTSQGDVKGVGKAAFLANLRANVAVRDALYHEVVRRGIGANSLGDLDTETDAAIEDGDAETPSASEPMGA